MAETDPSSSGPGQRFAVALALVVVLLLGAWPFLALASSVPLQPDSLTWIENSRPGAENWSEWVFHTSHFVGYRPLTALSFWADVELFGLSASALRATDLALHLTAAILVFLLARRLAGSWPAVLAALVFVAHPGCDEVVPFLARRSYSIATVGACAGLLLATRAVRPDTGGVVAFALVGPTLLLGMFGNELGAVLALALPVVAFASAREGSRKWAVLTWLWGWLWIGAGVFVRQRVVEGIGGYPTDGTLAERAGEVLALYGAALPGRLQGPGGAWTIVLMALGLYYAAVSVALLRGTRRTLVPLGLLLVIVAYGVAVASQRVWFPRQVYPATALVALLVAVSASRTLGPGNAALRSRLAHGVPLLLLIGVVLHSSPIVRGLRPGHAHMAEVATSFVDDVRASTAALELPARVFLVAPTTNGIESDRAFLRADWESGKSRAIQRRIQVPFRWLKLLAAGSELRFREMAYVVNARDFDGPTILTEPSLRLLLPSGATCFDASARGLQPMPPDRRTILGHAIKPRGAPASIWIYGDGGGTLTPVGRPGRGGR